MSLAADLKGLNALDPNNIGSWPLVIRIILIAIVCVAVLVAGYFVVIKPQLDQLDAEKSKEVRLKADFEAKYAKAAKLNAYKEQMAEIERTFGALLRQLPSKTEVADLLSEVSAAGAINGLNFQRFQPESEKPLEFYAELPIQLEVLGEYHQFGRFVSDVAQLPRIVTLHDFSIGELPGSEMGFIMEAQAKTYRYLDEDEVAKSGKPKAKKPGRKK